MLCIYLKLYVYSLQHEDIHVTSYQKSLYDFYETIKKLFKL